MGRLAVCLKLCTRLGWHNYYVKAFNLTGDKQAELLAMWYLLLHMAFDEQELS